MRGYMPKSSLFSDAVFDPETLAMLGSAFDTAWETVVKSGSPLAAPDQATATRALLAKRIIELAQTGERTKQRLVDGALEKLVGPK